MSHYKVHATFKRNAVSPLVSHWSYSHGPKATLSQDQFTFILSEEESWPLQRKFQREPVDYQLLHVVKRPGGSIADRTIAVRFFNAQSAVLFKLSRV